MSVNDRDYTDLCCVYSSTDVNDNDCLPDVSYNDVICKFINIYKKGNFGRKKNKVTTWSQVENVNPVFIHCAKNTEQLIMPEDNIIFNVTYSQKGDCALASSPSSDVIIWSSGYYHLYFNVYYKEPCQFSILKNGVIVNGAIVGSLTSNSQNSMTVIVEIDEVDLLYYESSLSFFGTACLLQIRNYTSNLECVLLNGQTGPINAVIVLHKLSDL
jgi:hypothetical protein